jgi:hypothetical protein
MMLEIKSFADAGLLAKERLVIKVLSDLDLGQYAVFSSEVSVDKSPTAGLNTAFWFADEAIKAGDLVVLYTKEGSSGKKDIGQGHTAHFYYWGLDKVLWQSDRCAVIIQTSNWISLPTDFDVAN